MQVLPSTAEHVAPRVGLTYDAKRLNDPAYNVQIGSGYLAELVSKFGPSVALVASAGFGFKLLGLAGAAFAHAIVPGVHKATVSTAIRSMAKDMGGRAEEARETRMRDAGVWDVGL